MGGRRSSWTSPSSRVERERFQIRIDRIKTISFIDAFDKVALGVSWDPQRVPYHLVCPLPDHFERSGSCYLQAHRWFCFGCSRGGDIIDFAQLYHEVETLPGAIKLVERCLGLVDTDEVEESDLAIKVAISRKPESPASKAKWELRCSVVAREFLDLVLPFVRCADPWIWDRANGIADMVYEEIEFAATSRPRSPRGRRERIGRLRDFSLGHAMGIEADALRMTGKDLLDCAVQAGCYPRILTNLDLS